MRRFDDYAAALKKAHVVLDADERTAIIFEGVKQAAFVHGLELIPDEGLLDEVAGLAEWPVVLIGAIEDQFMDVPAEILQTSMRTHQKYFALRDPKTGKMANRFALVANMIAEDGGKEIVAGNERVLRARLSDAKFFWDEDRKRTLESRVDDLKGIVFHAKLGTQYERVERIAKLAGEIAAKIGADLEESRTRRALGQGRSDHRRGGRISRTAGRDGPLLRPARQGRCRQSPTPSAITTSRLGRPTPCRRPRLRSRWRWRTSWISLLDFLPLARSRPALAILLPCAAPLWAYQHRLDNGFAFHLIV